MISAISIDWFSTKLYKYVHKRILFEFAKVTGHAIIVSCSFLGVTHSKSIDWAKLLIY